MDQIKTFTDAQKATEELAARVAEVLGDPNASLPKEVRLKYENGMHFLLKATDAFKFGAYLSELHSHDNKMP